MVICCNASILYLDMKLMIENEQAMRDWGRTFGTSLFGGEVIELVGDVGAGKTTLTKGIAEGMGALDVVQSPSFMISSVYDTTGSLRLAHYDFYRLSDAGIMAEELREVVRDSSMVTIVEWADVVSGVLPKNRTTIHIRFIDETARELQVEKNSVVSE